VALNVLIGGSPFKDIHLILFRAFPKFMTFGRGPFSEVYPTLGLTFYYEV